MSVILKELKGTKGALSIIVRDANDLHGCARDASGPWWSSLRVLVKSDNMGFSMNETIAQTGASLTLEYKNSL